MNARIAIASLLCASWPVSAQPVIADGGVTNAASYAILQAPGSGIAPGSIFVIFGTGLGPETLQSAPGYPLRTELAGTSVKLGESAVYMLYTSATQVAAVAPSTLQPGTHPLTVTFNNRTSAAMPVRLVQTDFGIFTRNSAGYGQAAAQTADPASGTHTLGLAFSVRPAEPIILYGTGLGAIAGAADDRPPGAVRTPATVEVVIAGKTVTPDYAGRSPNFAGLDQINFTAPADLGPECYAALAVRANGRLSNIVSVPVARDGRSCPHPFGLSDAALQRLDAGGTILGAQALMERFASPEGGAEGAGIGFAEMTANDLEQAVPTPQDPYEPTTEPGKCVVIADDRERTTATRPRVSRPRFLDAGDPLRLSGPSFSEELQHTPGSSYGVNLAGALKAGAWIYSGPGGAEIGFFQLTAELPEPLTWTNRQTSIDPKQPLRIDWSGGGSEVVRIAGTAGSEGPDGFRRGSFVCTARASDRGLTVPVGILAALPAGGSGGITVSQSIAKNGFSIPLARGGFVDGSHFRIIYQSSGSIQVRF